MALNDFVKEKKWPVVVALIIIIVGGVLYFMVAPKSNEMEKAKDDGKIEAPNVGNISDNPNETNKTTGVLV